MQVKWDEAMAALETAMERLSAAYERLRNVPPGDASRESQIEEARAMVRHARELLEALERTDWERPGVRVAGQARAGPGGDGSEPS